MDMTEKTLTSECVYDGGFIKVMHDTAELPNGNHAERTYVIHPGGVCVCAVTQEQEVVFVRQYRYAVGDDVLELPAGKIDEGETPEDCGRRELIEEAGAHFGEMIPLGVMYPTPGYSNEGIYMYLAKDIVLGEPKPDEDEFLDRVLMPFDKALRLCLTGGINDAKTIICMARAAAKLRGSIKYKE